jgi:hypothetical protein
MKYEDAPPVSRLGVICREICKRGGTQSDLEDWRYIFLRMRRDEDSERGIVILSYLRVEILRMEKNRFDEIEITNLEREYLTDEEVESIWVHKTIIDLM